MEKMMWLVNKSETDIDVCVNELKKWIKFKPQIPQQIPHSIGMRYLSFNLSICDNPDKYFEKIRSLKQLIIRDAGIGDLLLLEPVIRALKKDKNRYIALLTRYPEVLHLNPSIDKQIEQSAKSNVTAVNFADYDCWEDMRSYSETHPKRDTMHRTDIYNEKFFLEIEDKEPRIYFRDDEESILQKEAGYIYIGIQSDASHSYRRLINSDKLIKHIIADAETKNKKVKIVIFGAWSYIESEPNENIIDLQGKTSIREAMRCIRELDYFIGTDSGLMHCALTIHVPTVCIFTIITPELRLKYYTGQYKVVRNESLKCLGCGDNHMVDCREGHAKGGFIAPCLTIEPEKITDALWAMDTCEKRIFTVNIAHEHKKVNINILPERKLTMPIIVQNEEVNLPRFIELVIAHPAIGRVIAIDGGSYDNTVSLLTKAGCEVYIHPYISTYHNQQAIQREISFSYVPDNTPCVFFDIDECMNKQLWERLFLIADRCPDYGMIARKTFNYYADINDDSKRIKDFPDYQPRVYNWQNKYKFIGGAHHQTINTPKPEKLPIECCIMHFEKEGKDRDALEAQWKNMMDGVKKYA